MFLFRECFINKTQLSFTLETCRILNCNTTISYNLFVVRQFIILAFQTIQSLNTHLYLYFFKGPVCSVCPVGPAGCSVDTAGPAGVSVFSAGPSGSPDDPAGCPVGPAGCPVGPKGPSGSPDGPAGCTVGPAGCPVDPIGSPEGPAGCPFGTAGCPVGPAG